MVYGSPARGDLYTILITYFTPLGCCPDIFRKWSFEADSFSRDRMIEFDIICVQRLAVYQLCTAAVEPVSGDPVADM